LFVLVETPFDVLSTSMRKSKPILRRYKLVNIIEEMDNYDPLNFEIAK